jgi:hypothetical protein
MKSMTFNRNRALLWSCGFGITASAVVSVTVSQICRHSGTEIFPVILTWSIVVLGSWAIQKLIYKHQLAKIEAGRKRSRALRKRYRKIYKKRKDSK